MEASDAIQHSIAQPSPAHLGSPAVLHTLYQRRQWAGAGQAAWFQGSMLGPRVQDLWTCTSLMHLTSPAYICMSV